MSYKSFLVDERPTVAVVGAGVIGVGSALALLERAPYCKVTVFASEMSPDTTGDGAAGFFEPQFTGDTPEQDIRKWSKETWDLFRSWYDNGSPDVIKNYSIVLDAKPIQREDFFDIYKDFAYLSTEELLEYGDKYTCGIRFSTFTCEPKRFLPRLMDSIRALGGCFVKRKISNLEEFDGIADVVINCSGLGARELASDDDVTPLRGQVMRVHAPWIKDALGDNTEEGYSYVIPNVDRVVLGGTVQEDIWSKEVSLKDQREILEKCTRLIPSLKHAAVLEDWVGLRPFRSKGVRLEIDPSTLDPSKATVIHNYGHGKCGVTLFWGCAKEAASLALDAIAAKSEISSEL